MNKKYLLAIGLVLLVITIGISFSYFVSKTTENNLENANTQVPTAKIPEFKLETSVDTPESLPIYPGTKNYISATVKGIKEGGEDGDITEYQIKYTITGSVSVTGEPFTQGEVTYKLYKTTEKIEKPITCKNVTGTQGEADKQTEVHYTQECDLDNRLVNPVTLTTDDSDGSIIEGTATFTYEDLIPADNTTMHYYYLVVEYPETSLDQSDDMGKSITYSINSIVSTETGIKEDLSKKTFNQLASLACLESELKSEGVIDKNGFTDIDGSSSSCKVYEAEDDDGTSYYYRGDVQDNYVKFGKTGSGDDGEDIWWRIIRINGDGSIRMIYAGTGNGNTAPDQRQASTTMINNGAKYKFNTQYTDNMYVGFEYVSGIRNGHANNAGGSEATPSDALTSLNIWFKENLEDELTAPDSKIDTNAGFCGDRSAYSGKTPETKDNEAYGVNSQVTYYGSYIRNYPKGQNPGVGNSAYPTYKCEDEANDLYTYTGSNKGTKSLTYPIGLISADEVTYAGGLYYKNNTSYYLYNSSDYWTVSPSDFFGPCANMFRVDWYGSLYNYVVYNLGGLRPVLNLVSGALKSGTGVASDPYKVS